MNPMPIVLVTCSRWIIWMAFSALYLCSKMTASPDKTLVSTALSRPMTWNKGTMQSKRRFGTISNDGMLPSCWTMTRT